MPIEYLIDADQQCVFLRASGVITAWDLGVGAQQVWTDPAFHPHFKRLIDGSGITEMNIDSSIISAIASDVPKEQGAQVALVAVSDSVYNSFSEYRQKLQGVVTELFREVESAAQWLGVRLPDSWRPPKTDQPV